MALLICPECGNQISDKVIACPNCGCPSSEFNKTEEIKLICPDCGQEIINRNTPCPNCGCPPSEIKEEHNMELACPDCGQTVKKTDNVCPNCSCPAHLFIQKETTNNSVSQNNVPPTHNTSNFGCNIFAIWQFVAIAIFAITFFMVRNNSSEDNRPSFAGEYIYTDALNYTYKISLYGDGSGTYKLISPIKNDDLHRIAYKNEINGIPCSWERMAYSAGEGFSYYAYISLSSSRRKIYIHQQMVYYDYEDMQQHINGSPVRSN